MSFKQTTVQVTTVHLANITDALHHNCVSIIRDLTVILTDSLSTHLTKNTPD